MQIIEFSWSVKWYSHFGKHTLMYSPTITFYGYFYPREIKTRAICNRQNLETTHISFKWWYIHTIDTIIKNNKLWITL